MNQFDIYHRGQKIGTALVYREGLYYRFCCRCAFGEEGIHRLTARCGKNKIDLGICVPMENAFGLITKIPVSRIGEGEIAVSVETRDEENETVIPVSEDAPFPRLHDLDRAVFCSGGIRIIDRSADPRDSDQIRVYPNKSEQLLQGP